MTPFSESTIRSLQVRLRARLWRAWYRLRTDIRRMQSKAYYRMQRAERRPRLYRIEIR